jgi:hypothetical protein
LNGQTRRGKTLSFFAPTSPKSNLLLIDHNMIPSLPLKLLSCQLFQQWLPLMLLMLSCSKHCALFQALCLVLLFGELGWFLGIELATVKLRFIAGRCSIFSSFGGFTSMIFSHHFVLPPV